MKLVTLFALLAFSFNLLASPYRGDWDFKATGLRVADGEGETLVVNWCKRIPFVYENRCTGKESLVFHLDQDGIYTASDRSSSFWLLYNPENDTLFYKVVPSWGNEINIIGVRIKR